MRRIYLTCFIALVVSLLCAATALAGPVLPEQITLTQPDGTTIDAAPFGDEWDNGYETLDGYTLAQETASGVWSYAVLGDDGVLLPSGRRPGDDAPTGLAAHLRNADVYTPNRFPIFPQSEAGLAGNSGTQPVLVILVSFSDRAPVGSSAANWANHFFGATASAQNYYREVSGGQLTLTPATERQGVANDGIVGWLNLGYPHPNTRGSTGNANKQLTRDAIIAADPYVDFASFDANHDGQIASSEVHVVVIVAGYETSYGGASGACAPNVWGHQWALGSGVAAPIVDGVAVAGAAGGYTQFGEWHCSVNAPPGHMATMGIMVHELGHDLDWPDLYDVDYSSNGVGYWSIMSGGSWLALPGQYAGSLPPHPDAFLKWYQGWLTPQQISGAYGSVFIEQVETSQRVIQLLNNPNGVDWQFGVRSGLGEYYLLENRQKVSYDASLPGCGILIWHIDETRTSSNSANSNDSRRLVSLVEADGRGDLNRKINQGDTGDPYPGSAGNTVFNDSSTPSARLYSGGASGISITGISGCATVMKADISTGGATPTRTRTPTATGPSPTPSQTGTPTATRTPGGAWWVTYFPLILKDVPTPAPTATPTRTPTVTNTPLATGWVNILSETFEGSFPGPWRLFDEIPNNQVHYWGKRDCRAFSGRSSGWAVGGGVNGASLGCGVSYPDASTSVMMYGPFSLSGATRAEIRLKMWVNMESFYDMLCLYVSKDGATFRGQCTTGQTSEWVDWIYDLSNVGALGSLVGEPQVWVAIRFVSDETVNMTEGAYVDDIIVRKCVDDNCPLYSIPDIPGVIIQPGEMTIP